MSGEKKDFDNMFLSAITNLIKVDGDDWIWKDEFGKEHNLAYYSIPNANNYAVYILPLYEYGKVIEVGVSANVINFNIPRKISNQFERYFSNLLKNVEVGKDKESRKTKTVHVHFHLSEAYQENSDEFKALEQKVINCFNALKKSAAEIISKK